MKLSKILDAILIFPAIVWSFNGINDLSKKGFSSYTFLMPFLFKVHTISLLNIAIFYLATFLIIKPHKPVKNFLVASSLLFLSNALYELVYAIFMCNAFMLAPSIGSLTPPPFGGIIIALPLVLGGIFLLRFLNRQFHFLTNGRKRLFIFLAGFSSFIAAMLMLNNAGFFAEVYLYLSGQTISDPHNPLWILSKTLCVWMFFPLLGLYQKSEQTK
ncbi:MAG: hypothetical protein V1850_06505 [Candidatus Bathyarchaeota archaeon]